MVAMIGPVALKLQPRVSFSDLYENLLPGLKEKRQKVGSGAEEFPFKR